MVSMKDIAVACGVSVATVSKALNDYSDIGEDTKEHIRKTAKEMGYFPNAAAKALKTNRTYNIGVLFVDEAQSGLKHDYFSYVLDSFKRTAERWGYDMTFINGCKTRKNQMSYLDHARYRGFDGVVIACIDFKDPDVEALINSDIPLVTIDHPYDNRISIVSDNEKGMHDLLQFVYDKGHRKIAYVHGEGSEVADRRLQSFYNTAKSLGLVIPDEYMRTADYRDTKQAYIRTQELLDLPNPPTCILYPDDFASFGGINAIKERGLRIPEDVSVVGYDGIEIGKHIEPQLTTLQQDTEQLGEMAAKSLIRLIEHSEKARIQQIVVEGKVLEGRSISDISGK